MEEMYILHELQEHEPPDEKLVHEPAPHECEPIPAAEILPEPEAELVVEIITETAVQPTIEPASEQGLTFEPIEEPGPNWEMELAQAYVRAQPLDGVFPPEEGLRMGTAFPNLSMPYRGRE